MRVQEKGLNLETVREAPHHELHVGHLRLSLGDRRLGPAFSPGDHLPVSSCHRPPSSVHTCGAPRLPPTMGWVGLLRQGPSRWAAPTVKLGAAGGPTHSSRHGRGGAVLLVEGQGDPAPGMGGGGGSGRPLVACGWAWAQPPTLWSGHQVP